MPVVNMELTGFSFKRDHEDWIGPIEVPIENDSCAVLTGVNAGGKSLTLRALEKFTRLLAEPSKTNMEEFKVLAKVAGIAEISAAYSFWFSDIGDFYDVDLKDPEQFLSFAGAPSGMHLQPDYVFDITNRIETRFKDGGFSRRFGAYISGGLEFWNEETKEDREVFFTDLIFHQWKKVFDDQTNLSKDKMFRYGPDGFENEIFHLTGFDINAWGFEDHVFSSKEHRYQFVASKVIMLQVDEAYQVSADTMEKLRPFNENANAKEKGKTWIDERLKTAFEKCKKVFEEKAETEYRMKKKKAEADLERIEKIVPEGRAAQEVHAGRIKRGKTSLLELGELEDYLQSDGAKRKFAEFLYPKRKTEYLTDDEGNMFHPRIIGFKLEPHKTKDFNWVSNPHPPTADMSISPVEMQEKTPDYSDDIQGIVGRLMYHCPNLLREYDPELLFWIIVSGFIDFPVDPSPTYYSSGQRRMISIIEAVMNSERDAVLLIDEPELSLHIDWQRRFIDQISVFGKRLVLATHSPDIIYNHTEKVVEVPPSKEV